MSTSSNPITDRGQRGIGLQKAEKQTDKQLSDKRLLNIYRIELNRLKDAGIVSKNVLRSDPIRISKPNPHKCEIFKTTKTPPFLQSSPYEFFKMSLAESPNTTLTPAVSLTASKPNEPKLPTPRVRSNEELLTRDQIHRLPLTSSRKTSLKPSLKPDCEKMKLPPSPIPSLPRELLSVPKLTIKDLEAYKNDVNKDLLPDSPRRAAQIAKLFVEPNFDIGSDEVVEEAIASSETQNIPQGTSDSIFTLEEDEDI